jgi:hypothetical protein
MCGRPAKDMTGLTREQAMSIAASKANAEMDLANSRPIPRAAYEVVSILTGRHRSLADPPTPNPVWRAAARRVIRLHVLLG